MLMVSCALKKENKIKEDAILYPSGVWELSEISSIKKINKEFPNQLPTLIFEKTDSNLKAFGNDGCNNYEVDLTVKQNNILEIHSEISSTKILCNKVNNQLYLNNLKAVKSFELSENILKLHTTTDTLKFYRISLNGKWFLNKLYTTKKKIDDLYPYKKPFINIDINSNQISGFTACNSITANILIFQNTMQFNHIISTKMFCDGTGEKELTEALSKITNFELKGTKLLLSQKDKVIMEFIKKYE